ncbi:MAG: hypothetical protein J6Z30_01335, partial [Pyramidobacter sp.]|nr:hypothetical protein [Pyramidobacter sp.]
ASDDIIFFNNLNGGTATLAAGGSVSLVRATLNTLSADAGRDISIARLTAKSTSLTSGAKTTATGLIDSDVLTVVAGTDASFVDVKSKTLEISAGGNLTARTVRGYTAKLTAKGDVKANGDIDADTLTIASGANASLASLSAQRLTVTAGGDLAAMNVNADVVKMTSGGDLTVRGKLYGGQTNLDASGDVTVGGNTDVNALTVKSGANVQLAKVKTRGNMQVQAGGKLELKQDASSGGNMYLTAHEISVRNLTSKRFLTALSETTFVGSDLSAGGDLRVHTYGDMTFNDATAGGSAWILGLGSSAARLKFHTLRTGGRDTAVLLEHGYLDFWHVTAGLDVAIGVRTYVTPEDPAVSSGTFESLQPDTAYRIFYPWGRSLMPKDPFNFHVPDLLHDYAAGKDDIDSQGSEGEDAFNAFLQKLAREARQMWPLRILDLDHGEDAIEIRLDQYDYWLPEEAQ